MAAAELNGGGSEGRREVWPSVGPWCRLTPTFLCQPGLDATNGRAELAIRFGVIRCKVWGGSRTWVGARAQAVRMSVWRTCGQQGRSALDVLSQLLRGLPVPLT
jgi:transposase